MLDADTIYFLDPTVLFDAEKLKTTGILLLHDRIGGGGFLTEKVPGNPNLSMEQEYFSTFDVTHSDRCQHFSDHSPALCL